MTPPWPLPGQAREGVALLRDAIGRSVGRFVAVVVMSVSTAALEGAALVLLPSLLGMRLGDGPRRVASWVGPGLPGMLALYLGIVGVAAALLYTQTVVSSRLTLDFGERLRLRLHAAVLRAGWGTAALARPADIVHALIGEAAQCANATQTAIQLAARLVYLPSLVVAALVLSPRLAAAALALSLVAGVPMLLLARRAYASALGMARAGKQLHRTVSDDLAGLKAIKAFGAEAARRQAFRECLDETRDAALGQTRAAAAVQAWQRLAAAATAALAALYGFAVLHLDGAVMLALTLALARLASTMTQALDLWRQLGRLLPVYGQFRDCEARCLAAAEPAAAPAPELRRELRLRDVAYMHPGDAAPTLVGMNLGLPAYAITAVTGPSGAGKSTLADLVLGLITPTSGEILVDGTPLAGASRVAWRRKVAYVPQDPFLFHASIRANLRLADATADDADLWRALEAAAATFVGRLPDGLDTIVGDRGNRLSGGERQRLMIARALLKAPDLLVLDEATNALDPVSEARVIATLRQLASRTTVLVIAHRSALVAAADRVLHLENGRIVATEDTSETVDRQDAPA